MTHVVSETASKDDYKHLLIQVFILNIFSRGPNCYGN